jgi:hypothetical protein
MLTTLTTLLSLSCALTTTHAITTEQVADATRDILTLIIGDATAAGGFVRLGFHDAGTFDMHNPTTSGRPDGCVDLTVPDNAGLSSVIDMLAPVAANHRDAMSRADLWQLAANVAISFSLPRGASMPLQIRYGRVDVDMCADSDHSMLPDAELTNQHTRAVFVDRMGFEQTEVTALMGAHTLGRADADASGYDGSWVQNSATFDNDYYDDIINRPWVRETNQNGQHLWRDPGNPETLMLNTDMSLAFDIGDDATVNSNNCRTGGGGGGGGGQRGNNCPRTGDSINDVETFAANREAWYFAFSKAWQKLQQLGYNPETDLSLPTGDAILIVNSVAQGGNDGGGAGGTGGAGGAGGRINVVSIVLSVSVVLVFVFLASLLVCCLYRRRSAALHSTSERFVTVVVQQPKIVTSTPIPMKTTESDDVQVVVIAMPTQLSVPTADDDA